MTTANSSFSCDPDWLVPGPRTFVVDLDKAGSASLQKEDIFRPAFWASCAQILAPHDRLHVWGPFDKSRVKFSFQSSFEVILEVTAIDDRGVHTRVFEDLTDEEVIYE